MDQGTNDDGLDLIWGVEPIAAELGLARRPTYNLLERGRIPAQKIGGKWCASRKGLRAFFSVLVAGEIDKRELA